MRSHKNCKMNSIFVNVDEFWTSIEMGFICASAMGFIYVSGDFG